MSHRKILVPVHESLSAASIARNAFWLAREQDADLYLVEVITPPGLLSWLLSPLVKRHGNAELAETRRRVVWVERLPCKTSELRAPNLLLGIVEVAQQVRPDIIILVPELQERMGRVSVEELQRRLGEVSCCMLILPARNLSCKVVSCGNRKSMAIDRAKGFVQGPGSVIFPKCWGNPPEKITQSQ